MHKLILSSPNYFGWLEGPSLEVRFIVNKAKAQDFPGLKAPQR